MNANVYYLSLLEDTPCRGYWDYALLDDLLAEFTQHEVRRVPIVDFGIFVIPARSHAKPETVKELKKQLAKVPAKIIFFMGDEERVFPVEEFVGDKTHIWVQNPRPETDGAYNLLGCGYTPHVAKYHAKLQEKNLNFFFAGQVTHARREEMASQLRGRKDGVLNETKSFTAGFSQEEYSYLMSCAKVVPAPSGPETPDTFRLFEALELGAVPIADNETAKKDWSGFWGWLFGESVPFPMINTYTDLVGYIGDCVAQYPKMNNRVQSWWFAQKTKLRQKISDSIFELSGENTLHPITVVVPVSPIKLHPDTSILEITITSIRKHLPNAEIILTFDGVREEQEKMRKRYEEHIRKVLWLARSWGNVTPVIFEEHIHQSGMMRAILDKIRTPLLMYVEQDTPLVNDEPIEWEMIQDTILSGKASVIRLHHEGVIPKEHTQMMIGGVEGNLLKTYQWSQRPHVASVAFYRRIMSEHFSDKSRCFIEDLIHGRLIEAFLLDGEQGWDQWRVYIYHPQTGNIKRSYHTDGRSGGAKYDSTQVW